MGFTLLESLLCIKQYFSREVILQLAVICSFTLLQLIINSGQGMDMVIKGQIQQAGGYK